MERTKRTEMLLGAAGMERLRGARVAVLGLGGVGSWCAEALARCGVGSLVLADEDDFAESNINRQLGALYSTLGKAKAEAMAERLRDIAPEAEIIALKYRYEAATREELFALRPDFIADCIDLVSCKLDLIVTARERGVRLVSALGTGNKTDAQQLCITDIARTRGCPLARVMRRELRERGIEHLNVVYSPEEAQKPQQTEEPPPGRRSVPASLVWVPATAGLLMAQHIVTELTN